jgi:hypothetical protein
MSHQHALIKIQSCTPTVLVKSSRPKSKSSGRTKRQAVRNPDNHASPRAAEAMRHMGLVTAKHPQNLQKSRTKYQSLRGQTLPETWIRNV